MKKIIPWAFVSFVLSLASSAVFGRSLWCDEILRINGQHYTISQLFAFKHLHDFCTQTPTGYLFMRPFQLLLGYEFGGCLVSALAAFVITGSVLWLLRRFNHGKFGSLSAALVATNPLLIFYGSELAFYEMWAAAFAVAFVLLFEIDDQVDFKSACWRRLGFVVAGSLFVTFHFAGMFVWVGLAGFAVIDRWFRKGFQSAFFRGVLFGVPMLVNLPMYLGAEGKAIHLGSQHVVWKGLSSLPGQLLEYVMNLFPEFTGAWVLGVLIFLVGLVLLFTSRETRQVAVFAIGGILSVLFFLAYSGLHEYIPMVSRYWLFALTPTLFVMAFAIERIFERIRAAAIAVALLVVVSNLMCDYLLLVAEGRTAPYRKMIETVDGREVSGRCVVFVNHYETRFFGGYYHFKEGINLCYPSYWEQGETARLGGLRQIHALSPLSPLYTCLGDQREMARQAGWTTKNEVRAHRSALAPLLAALRLVDKSAADDDSGVVLLFPLESELVAEAEKTGKPVFAPGREWTLRQMPPKDQKLPFTPFLMLSAKRQGVLRVYIPKNFTADRFTLSGMVGSSKPGSATFGGKVVSFGTNMTRVTVPVESVRKGEWNEIPVKAGESFAAFMMPAVN